MAIVILISFLASVFGSLFFRNIKQLRIFSLTMGLISSVLVIYFFAAPLLTGTVIVLGRFIRIDSFSAYIAELIGILYFFAALVSDRYISDEVKEKAMNIKQARLYFVLLPIFVMAMLFVVSADNLGLLWLALEITTLATTPLVAIYKKEGSLEAAWKYIIICSLGISLGLFGLLMVSYAGIHSGLGQLDSLSLKSLALQAANLNPLVMKWAFLFTFIGLGTKVGFFPMHTWLPDAHGRTPSPISAMLSGILLNVALYSIIRVKMITDLSLGDFEWTGRVFIFFGVMSIAASAFFVFIQHNYKRMLAYSSIEHMGILALAVGLGPVAMVPALMHMFAHTFSKSLLFFGSGEILLHFKSAKINNIKNLFRIMPITSSCFIVGLLSLLAFPPFAAFVSEIMIMGAAIMTGKIAVFFIVSASLTLVCVSLFQHAFKMFCIEDIQADPGKTHSHLKKEKFNITHSVMIAEIVLLIFAGVYMLTPAGYDFFAGIVKSISL